MKGTRAAPFLKAEQKFICAADRWRVVEAVATWISIVALVGCMLLDHWLTRRTGAGLLATSGMGVVIAFIGDWRSKQIMERWGAAVGRGNVRCQRRAEGRAVVYDARARLHVVGREEP